jgi:hypothetical protein
VPSVPCSPDASVLEISVLEISVLEISVLEISVLEISVLKVQENGKGTVPEYSFSLRIKGAFDQEDSSCRSGLS